LQLLLLLLLLVLLLLLLLLLLLEQSPAKNFEASKGHHLKSFGAKVGH